MSNNHLTETSFDHFQLDPSLLAGLHAAGFTYCTPIQAQTLPLALAGTDVAGQAQTGTGKTIAFLLATLHRLTVQPAADTRRPNQPRALIVAPTRELAAQIHKDACVLATHTEYAIQVVYGGTGYETQRQAITEGVDILIGTPGRLIDYYKQQVFDLHAVQVLVMDEADRMFDLGFLQDIRFLLRRCPPPEQRLGLLFSATLSCRVTELAYEHMNHPQSVVVEAEQITADRVRESGHLVANHEKIGLLLGFLCYLEHARSIVFVNTKRQADRVWGYLQGNGYQAAILSGDVPQTKRESLLQRFANTELAILVATDVAARGLHIAGVTHVFNYDLPEDPEDYVHRIGRTARAGATGDAISFVCETYAMALPDIETYIGHKIPTRAVTAELLVPVDPRSCKLTPHAAARATERSSGARSERRSPLRTRSRSGRRPTAAPSR